MTWADTHLCTPHNTLRGVYVADTAAQVEYRSQSSSGYLHPVKQSFPCPAGRLCLNRAPHCTAVFHAFSAQLCRKLTLAPRARWLQHRPILGHFHMNFFPSLPDTYWSLRCRLCINHSPAPLWVNKGHFVRKCEWSALDVLNLPRVWSTFTRLVP